MWNEKMKRMREERGEDVAIKKRRERMKKKEEGENMGGSK